MKTFFGKLFVRFDFMAHPAGGWLSKKEEPPKRKSIKSNGAPALSPDSFNMRSPGSKKQQSLRRTPAP